MTAPRETEVKLQVPNARHIRQRLKERGFRVVEARRFESNRLLDFADLSLRKSRRLLRLRFEGARTLVTFKGAPIASRVYKVRREVETYVADGRPMREIFKSLGLGETFRYDKYRTTFARRRDGARTPAPLVELDETPIGNYLELEGPGRWIDKVARELGYSRKDYITASYAALYFERCRREGRRPRNMVFSLGK
jgi:adenylate cyclase, class 2